MSVVSDPSRTVSGPSSVAEGLRARLPHVRERYRLHPVVAIFLITVVLPIGFDIGSFYMNLQRSFLLIMIIPLLVRFFAGHAGKFIPTDFLFLIMLVWMPISLYQTTPAQAITFSGSVGMEFIGGYLIGRLYIRSRAQFIALCRWLVVIALCLLPLALFETLTNRPPVIEFINRLPHPIRDVINVQHAPRQGLYRAQTVFVHPIMSGLFCAVVFSLCYIGLKDVYSNTRRVISAALIFLVGFLALSSGALLALVLQLGFIMWAAVFRNLKWRWWLLAGLCVLAYIVVDVASTRTPLQVFFTYATFSPHTAYWRMIIFDWGMMNIFGSVEHDIPPARMFGVGVSGWVRPHFVRSGSVDNFWLVMGMRHGVPGAVLMMSGYALLVVYLIRAKLEDPRLVQIRQALVFTFIGLAVTLSTVHVWTQVFSFVCFMLGASVWLIGAQAQAQQAEQTVPSTENGPRKVQTNDRPALPYSRFAHHPAQRDTAAPNSGPVP